MVHLAYKICIQSLIFNAVYSQCANRIMQGPNGPIELLPNQVLLPPGTVLQGQGRPVLLPGPNPPYIPAQPMVVPPITVPAEYNMPLPPLITPNIPNGYSGVILPNTGPGNMIVPSGNMIVPSGNMIVPSGNMIVPSGNMFVPNAPSGVSPYTETYAPNVIHDNSVANSLAQALQMLVVSNLLGKSLPGPFMTPCYDGYKPGYSYIY